MQQMEVTEGMEKGGGGSPNETRVELFKSHLPSPRAAMLGFLAALLRFYGSSSSIPIPALPLTLLGGSLAAFLLASAALLVDLGIEWNR
jgi:hypothetical protein